MSVAKLTDDERKQLLPQLEGWEMAQGKDAIVKTFTLDDFVAAATRVLERRVANAPSERNEQRWLAGWRNRLQSYLPDK